jgi:hypothetical protein
MTWKHTPTDTIVYPDADWRDENGTQYPPGWDAWSDDEKAAHGLVYTPDVSPPRVLADVLAAKLSEINALRNIKRYPGNVATDLGWSVDLRNSTDEANITGKVIKALTIKDAGTSDAITFVGADNEARALTADQMIAVGSAADAYVSGIYAVSWYHKGQLAQITGTDAEKIAAIDSYDITAGW